MTGQSNGAPHTVTPPQRVTLNIRLDNSAFGSRDALAAANTLIDAIDARLRAAGLGQNTGAGTGMGYRDADFEGPDADGIAAVVRELCAGRVAPGSYLTIARADDDPVVESLGPSQGTPEAGDAAD